MKKILYLFLLLPFFGFSQVKLSGLIVDTNGEPLEMANVMAQNVSSKTMDSFIITNDKGFYALHLKPNVEYLIKVSYIGMKPKELLVKTSATDEVKNIVLESGGIELKGVEIVREMPVSVKGDTIVYNADSFKNGTERKLEDVLKKMPGVEVNADGEVEVEGKKVSKLMVNNKPFFNGDTKLGVKNIPSDAIDKVQVVRNFNEIKQMKGLENDQDNLAMNVILKEGKENFWFGDLSASADLGNLGDNYLVNPKLFYYNKRASINFIGNLNNIGELPMTMQDYFKLTGGMRNLGKKGGSSFNVGSNNLGLSFLRNNRAKEIDTKFGATNFTYNISKSLEFSGFGIFSDSKTNIETKSTTTYLANGSVDRLDEQTSSNSKLGLVKFKSSYNPNDDLQVDYDIMVKNSDQNEQGFSTRNTTLNGVSRSETIMTDKSQKPISVNQGLSTFYTYNTRNIFAVEMQHFYQNEDPFYQAILQRMPFQLEGLDGLQNQANINQNRMVKTNKLDSKLDYFYMLTKKSSLNVTFGNTFSNQRFDSSIFQILDNGEKKPLELPKYNNQVTYAYSDTYLSMHLKWIVGKVTLMPGLNAHLYSLNNEQLGINNKQNFAQLLPDFFALYQIKKAESLSYNFAITNDFTDINQLAEGYILNSYRSIYRGNPLLENATSQSHTLRYNRYNMFNFENINASMSYSRKLNAVKSVLNFEGANQIGTSFNSNFADENFNSFVNYNRTFSRYYKATASVRVAWSKFYNIQNAQLAGTESFSQDYTAKFGTNFKELPNLEVGYSWTKNQYSGSTFFTNKPFVSLEYFFLKGFALTSLYEYYRYANQTDVLNKYQFLSAGINYRKDKSHWEYRLDATNLLNNKSLNDDSFGQTFTRTSQYFIQPRYIMLGIKYNL